MNDNKKTNRCRRMRGATDIDGGAKRGTERKKWWG